MAEEPKRPPQASPEPAGGEAQPGTDAAGRSLVHALRLSFIILTVVILGLLLLFFARGFFTVQSGHMALIVRFGVTDESKVRDPGSFYYAFPYPIDEKVDVDCSQTTIQVNTFWPKVKDEVKEETLEGKEPIAEEKRVVKDAGDGFLLTGDQNILESCWTVTYRVKKDAKSLVEYYKKIGSDQDGEKGKLLVKMTLQNAVTREVGRMTVEDAYSEKRGELTTRVKKTLTSLIEGLHCGMAIDTVSLVDIVPPTRVKPAFEAATEAGQISHTMKVEAQKMAQSTLTSAIGPDNARLLVEAIQDVRRIGTEQEWDWLRGTADEQKDKITRIQEARKRKREELDNMITRILKDKVAWAGTAREILQDGEADAERMINDAKRDAEQLAELLKEKNPKALTTHLDRLRIETLQQVLKQAYENWVVHAIDPGAGRELEIIVNRRPELLRIQKTPQETR